MDEMKTMVVNTALKKMLKGGYLDICLIKKLQALTGAIPKREDMEVLEALHCVHWDEMPPELLRGMPVLVERVIGSDGIELSFKKFSETIHLLAVSQ